MKTAICIASGPSLTQDDVDYCKGKGTVYVVKECWRMAPWADALYAADDDWFTRDESWREFEGRKITCGNEAIKKYAELEHVEAKPHWHWSYEQGKVATGGNSGFQTMNIATLEGADRVILLGYDYGFDTNMPKHWWEKEYPRDSRYSNYKEWLKKLNMAAPHIPVDVFNASRETSITCFTRTPIEALL